MNEQAVVDYPLAVRGMAGKTDTMDTTYTDIRNGKRHDIEVEFITRRAVDCNGERVHRLLVADRMGTQFTVLATPDSEPLLDLKTGGMHRISRMLGATPLRSSGDIEAACPDCGGQLRPGQVVDAAGAAVTQAASQFSLDERFGIIDARTTVRRVREDRLLVDEWTPMNDDRPVTPPDYVCESCRRHVHAHEL